MIVFYAAFCLFFRDEMALQTCWRITMMYSKVHHRTALMVILSTIWVLSQPMLKSFNTIYFSRSYGSPFTRYFVDFSGWNGAPNMLMPMPRYAFRSPLGYFSLYMSPIAILSHLILKRLNIFLFSRSPVSYIRSILRFSDETALEINVRRNTMCHQGYPEKMLTFLCHNFIVHLSRAQIVQ